MGRTNAGKQHCHNWERVVSKDSVPPSDFLNLLLDNSSSFSPGTLIKGDNFSWGSFVGRDDVLMWSWMSLLCTKDSMGKRRRSGTHKYLGNFGLVLREESPTTTHMLQFENCSQCVLTWSQSGIILLFSKSKGQS